MQGISQYSSRDRLPQNGLATLGIRLPRATSARSQKPIIRFPGAIVNSPLQVEQS
jgi:hypothetical protein